MWSIHNVKFSVYFLHFLCQQMALGFCMPNAWTNNLFQYWKWQQSSNLMMKKLLSKKLLAAISVGNKCKKTFLHEPLFLPKTWGHFLRESDLTLCHSCHWIELDLHKFCFISFLPIFVQVVEESGSFMCRTGFFFYCSLSWVQLYFLLEKKLRPHGTKIEYFELQGLFYRESF